MALKMEVDEIDNISETETYRKASGSSGFTCGHYQVWGLCH